MKRFFIFSIMFALLIANCGKKSEIVKLKKGTPAFELAQELATKIAYLNPEENNPLITTSEFSVTSGEVIQSIYDNSGKRTEQLKKMDANRIKAIVLQSARRIAERKLVLKEAEREKFSVAPTMLDSLLNLQYQRAGGEEKFKTMLQESGASFEAVKKDMSDYLLFDRYLDKVIGKNIQISDEEIQKAYDDYRGKEIATVRHILLMTQGKKGPEKQQIRKKMEDILARARSGEDFAELARQYTEDPGSKENGGLYENFTRGTMVKPFEDAAFSVPVGKISDIVETRYGYHILKVIARNNYKTLEEYKPELEERLKSKRKPQAFREYMDNLKKEKQYQENSF